ncbi:MAG TPA: flagellin [Stellaceae bacterium]
MLAGSINTNVSALFALNALSNTSNKTSSLEQQLSSGLAINSPADNPAGFIAAQGFQTQIGGVTQATSNANQAISLVQTADGAVQQQINLLQQIRTIADQAANGINSPSELSSLQGVVSQLQTQITTISQQTQFNNQNLLDGSFQGVQFQTGPNAGQTIQLSIANTASTAVGANQSKASVAGASVYIAGGSGTGGAGDNTGHSYAITAAGGGAFTAAAVGVSGSSGSKAFSVTAVNESAHDIATAANAVQSSTNVSAIANTSVAFTVTSGSFSFSLGNGSGTAQTNSANITATVTSATSTGLSPLVQAINAQTSATGVTAAVNSSNQLVLTQAQGQNISVAGFAGTGTLAAGGSTTVTLGGAVTSATVQGLVTFQSTQGYALSTAGAAAVGLQANSSLSSLSSVNVSTVGGANAALNIVDFAIQSLENVGGGLGASQQQLQATVSNLQTTQANLTTAQGVVQDANIPQVTTQLTQQQILQQAGVSALAQSSQLQQSFLKLLQ